VENGIVRGGFGSEGQEALLRADYRGTILRYGWPDEFIPQGDPQTLYERYGLTACKLESGIVEALGAQP
jgi:deoxyxylulose-5-phosphate synthase